MRWGLVPVLATQGWGPIPLREWTSAVPRYRTGSVSSSPVCSLLCLKDTARLKKSSRVSQLDLEVNILKPPYDFNQSIVWHFGLKLWVRFQSSIMFNAPLNFVFLLNSYLTWDLLGKQVDGWAVVKLKIYILLLRN